MTHWIERFGTAPEGYSYREFRREDGIMEGVEIEHAIIGGTMEKDGVPVAYAGINQIADKHWCFFYIKDESIREHGLWIVRLVRDSIRAAKVSGITELYALCDPSKPNSDRFLERLGFVPLNVYEKSVDVMIYERLMSNWRAWRRTESE
jgi:RimJ/RimL family protein N-acetyltransferase